MPAWRWAEELPKWSLTGRTPMDRNLPGRQRSSQGRVNSTGRNPLTAAGSGREIYFGGTKDEEHSCSLSELRFTNGSTAMEGVRASVVPGAALGVAIPRTAKYQI